VVQPIIQDFNENKKYVVMTANLTFNNTKHKSFLTSKVNSSNVSMNSS